ncbi:hypothetical protein CPAST_c04820 [Clostridium pasteurianum DSM 525 = ATCC 6013]|uniref:Uncharacterized protein n=1 Tax=Clostridium pasteurianum DSM 525 = ATCC 6013 TaxID=1262449 RepID=A0A0H3J1H1_CLOPA|nr:hypothetical protein [Clostridium pasteurianum]AJA46582.1 hypothetical protein CPAST_c04820 [Clostridium pasteurianum DSM 525 = ATCC 6013]AJA50570.1 hypothetical protein CLPA_c04820 [Clostridium pasteurianum DSM 525 = ATCC 6013]KRU13418.1 hypothetical protein CP6013_02666 [Clostridium pasteurianum DSM 525 = ATCC 6013]
MQIKEGKDYYDILEKLEEKVEFSCAWNTCTQNSASNPGNPSCGIVNCQVDNMG